jgi:organic radical activating enzyme
MSITGNIGRSIPYHSNARRYIRYLAEEARTLTRTLAPWEHRATRPPETLFIETTNICNANCVFCAYQYQPDFRVGKGVMDDALFHRVLDEYAALGGERVSFTPIVGDPLVDPEIVERLGAAVAAGFDVRFYTNGILFNKIDVSGLVKTGIRTINVSLAPFDREQHEILYRSHHYDDLIEGIVKLLKTRNEQKAALTLHLEFRAGLPLSRILAFPDFQKRVAPFLSTDEHRAITVQIKGYDSWGGQIAKEDLVDGMALAIPPRLKHRPCVRTFQPTVLWDGKVRACSCVFAPAPAKDSNDGLLVGDMHEAHLRDIWTGPRMHALRRRFTDGDCLPLCKVCTSYRAC